MVSTMKDLCEFVRRSDESTEQHICILLYMDMERIASGLMPFQICSCLAHLCGAIVFGICGGENVEVSCKRKCLVVIYVKEQEENEKKSQSQYFIFSVWPSPAELRVCSFNSPAWICELIKFSYAVFVVVVEECVCVCVRVGHVCVCDCINV